MKNNEIIYAEVDTILNMMDERYKNKIPKKLISMFKEEKSHDYEPKIDTQKSLNEQKLQRETLVILAILSLNYWCESEEERQELIKSYSENKKKSEAEIREKYNPDNIFKTKNEVKENTRMIEYHESTFKRLLNKIKSFFVKENR